MRTLSELDLKKAAGGQRTVSDRADSLGAIAYTQGQDYYVYNPQDNALVSHESQHIVQQSQRIFQ